MKWIAVGVGVLVLGALLGTALPVSAQSAPEIPLVIEKNRFQPDVIKVKAGQSFVLVITNKDKGPEELDMQQPRIEKVIPGKSKATIYVGPLKAGEYKFVGEFNEKTAHGVIVAK